MCQIMRTVFQDGTLNSSEHAQVTMLTQRNGIVYFKTSLRMSTRCRHGECSTEKHDYRHDQGGMAKQDSRREGEISRTCAARRSHGTCISQYCWQTSHALLAIEANLSESVVVPYRFTIWA